MTTDVSLKSWKVWNEKLLKQKLGKLEQQTLCSSNNWNIKNNTKYKMVQQQQLCKILKNWSNYERTLGMKVGCWTYDMCFIYIECSLKIIQAATNLNGLR